MLGFGATLSVPNKLCVKVVCRFCTGARQLETCVIVTSLSKMVDWMKELFHFGSITSSYRWMEGVTTW